MVPKGIGGSGRRIRTVFLSSKGKEGHPPSGNYRSYFGGSVWEPIEGTEYYYFHAFAKEQPDLNWTNPKVRKEIYRMINWWLEKGVAGFRIDAIINIKKDLDFPDMEPDGKDGLVSYTKSSSNRWKAWKKCYRS